MIRGYHLNQLHDSRLATFSQPANPPDLAQRIAAIYDRAAMRFREHEAAQHVRIVIALEGVATVQSATVGSVLCKRVIVAAKRESDECRDRRREELLTELAAHVREGRAW